MPSRKKLLQYSERHLFYEIWMLFGIGEVLARSPVASEIFRYALIESFVIHLRNVIVFLYPPRHRKPSDVVAEHFFDRPDEWKKKLPPLSAALQKAKTRADKEVAHLTTGRIAGAPLEKGWPARQLLDELKKRLKLFAQLASEARLHSNVKQIVDLI